jgi:hypothetical protein
MEGLPPPPSTRPTRLIEASRYGSRSKGPCEARRWLIEGAGINPELRCTVPAQWRQKPTCKRRVFQHRFDIANKEALSVNAKNTTAMFRKHAQKREFFEDGTMARLASMRPVVR